MTVSPTARYSGGYQASWQSDGHRARSLAQLIGGPSVEIEDEINFEHTEVEDGFGASNSKVTSLDFSVTFTPNNEYGFVTDPRWTILMDGGKDPATGAC